MGATRDYLVVGSDSGRIVILEFDGKSNTFVKIHQETFGKTGCRRIVPGEYLAIDPQGRACMIAAVEKQKFVYILNRDLNQKLTISSPLEAHKAGALVYSLIALDVGFDNPLFASIEVGYAESPIKKTFTIHEMDLGINHVVRKYAEPVSDSAHLLVPVTGGTEGPGGCLVCCENFLIYRKIGRESIACAYPRRLDCPLDKGVMIVAFARHKLKDFTLLLLQTEFGDLLRVDLISPQIGVVVEVRVTYFDSIPRATSLCVLKTGFMFAASESGNHCLYQFQPGNLLNPLPDPQESVFCSSTFGQDFIRGFRPKRLSALSVFDELQSLCPMTDMQVLDVEGSSQIYALCGRGSSRNPSLKVMKYGLGVTEMALTDLPGKPSGVWTISGEDKVTDKYIVISFVDATLVLSIGEIVQEVTNSGLVAAVQTLGVGKMYDGSIVQVHHKGIRHFHEQTGKVSEWRPKAGKQVLFASLNSRQVVVGTLGGEIVYFEIASETGLIQEIARREMGSEVTCVSLGTVGENRTRSLFMAVSASDRSVRVLSLEPDKILKQLSAQSYQVAAESTAITEGFLNIGLSNGTLVRCCLDRVTGVLSDPRSRFLGVRPVRLQKLKHDNREVVVALSSRPWLIDPQTVGTVPLTYSQEVDGLESPVVLEYAASFNSEQCPDGLVAIAQSSLRIVGLDRLNGSTFSQKNVALSYTPRKIVLVPPPFQGVTRNMLAVLETDHRAFSDEAKAQLAQELAAVQVETPPEHEDDLTLIGTCGSANEGTWGSCIRIIDPVTLETQFRLEMGKNESAVALSVVYFYQLKDKRPCLVVASCQDAELYPLRTCKRSTLKTYLYDESFMPQLVHVTPVAEEFGSGVPLAMCQFEGRLLVSISSGKSGTALLRLYELGKKRLLKKSEYRNTTCGGFMNIQVINDRIFAADIHNSVHVLRLNKVDGQLYVVCDDTVQRYMSAMLAVDYNTVIGADKFDNLFVNRIPPEVRDQQAGTGESLLGSGGLRLGPDTAYILGKNHKFDPENQFHLGETVTSLHRVVMSSGATEVVMWSTLSGSIGVMYPFISKKEYEVFLALENHMRSAVGTSLTGRDHCSFRSFYLPVKGVIDGDLISSFRHCKNKESIAEAVGKSVNEIEKIIEEIQNRIT